MITLGLAVVGGMVMVMVINAIIGIHDQFVPESMSWFYSHYSRDGEGQSPTVGGLAGSGALGAAVWFAVRR